MIAGLEAGSAEMAEFVAERMPPVARLFRDSLDEFRRTPEGAAAYRAWAVSRRHRFARCLPGRRMQIYREVGVEFAPGIAALRA